MQPHSDHFDSIFWTKTNSGTSKDFSQYCPQLYFEALACMNMLICFDHSVVGDTTFW